MNQLTRIHLTNSFGEHEIGNYYCCNKCEGKTMLISAMSEWRVDSEPYASGEQDVVLVDDEVTAHYCPKCERITSISFNSAP